MMGKSILEYTEFDFAFSFAGEDREIVEAIYEQLSADGIRVFYDNAYQSHLVGKDLYYGLRDLYKNKGRYVVCFISKHYSEKVWTNLEFTAIKERLMSTFFASDFLIPILIGDVKILDDIPSFFGFYTYQSVDETVAMLKEKIHTSIVENHLIENVNNCISYICPKIYERLQAHNITAVLRSNTLIVETAARKCSFCFTGDTVMYTPCIQIIKRDETSAEFPTMDAFPSYLITWKQRGRLTFLIHEFDGNEHVELKDYSINELINHISACIESEVRG